MSKIFDAFFEKKTIWLLGPTFIILLFNLCFFNRYYPLSEGWWQTYGYLINQSKVPYKDFTLTFPLFFVFLNALYLKISTSLFLQQLLGVILICANVILAQLYLRRFFNLQISAFAALLSMFLLMSDIIFIANDYQTYLILLVLATLLLSQYAISNYKNNRLSLFFIFLVGVFVGLQILLKQNVGVFVFLSFIGAIAILSNLSLTKKITWTVFYGLGVTCVILSMLFYLQTHHILNVFLQSVFLNNDSKGSKFVVLTRFLSDPMCRQMLFASVIFFFGYLFLKSYRSLTSDYIVKNKHLIKSLFPLVCLGLVGILAFCYNLFFLVFLILMLTILWVSLYNIFFLNLEKEQTDRYKLVTFPLLALLYCNTQSASFNVTGMYFIYLFCIAYALTGCQHYFMKNIKFFATLLGIIIAFIFAHKMLLPYSWWGLNQGPVYTAKYSINYPEFSRIYVDKATAEAFNDINFAITKYSRSADDVYLFPDIPIFYFLNHKLPPYRNVVQWFDVTNSYDIQNEYTNFLSKLPRVIIFLQPPDYVYAGHQALLSRDLYQKHFQNEFERLVKNGTYAVQIYTLGVSQKPNAANLTPKTWWILVENYQLNNKSLNYIAHMISEPNDLTVTGIIRNNIQYPIESGEMKVKLGDVLVLHSNEANIAKIINHVGTILNGPYYTLKIYVKNSTAVQQKNETN